MHPILSNVIEARDDRILDLKSASSKTEGSVSSSKYRCIVCDFNAISLSELHWHQTYKHSTEELSLSVIGDKGLIKIVQKQNQEMSEPSVYDGLSKKSSQFYFLSSAILHVNERNSKLEDPVNYSKEHPIETRDDCLVPMETIWMQMPDPTSIIQEGCQFRVWEEELKSVQSISDENFNKCIDELCTDLGEIKNPPLAKKKYKRK